MTCLALETENEYLKETLGLVKRLGISKELIRECVTVPGSCCCMPLLHRLVQLCTQKYTISRQRGCIFTPLTPPKSATDALPLQASSYNQWYLHLENPCGTEKVAMVGKTISLYSFLFYTGRYGYKICLRLYMNGDGSGKGTHLYFFLTITWGECDALLM